MRIMLIQPDSVELFRQASVLSDCNKCEFWLPEPFHAKTMVINFTFWIAYKRANIKFVLFDQDFSLALK